MTPASTSQEALRGVDVDQVHLQVAAEGVEDALRLLAAQQAVVDEDAGQLVADGAVDERRRDRRVDAAGEGADDAAVAHLLADALDALADEVRRRPVAAAAADAVEEVADDLLALRRVHDLRVELEAEHAVVVAHDGDGRVVGVGEGAEAGRHLRDAVAVAHPDGDRRRQVGEQLRLLRLVDDGVAVLAPLARRNAPAELVGQELHPVADAEHRQPLLEDVGRRQRRALAVDAGRAAGEDEALAR